TGMAPAMASAIRVYPNPTRGIVTLVLPAGLGVPVQLSVYDARGKQLLSRSLAAGTEKTDVDLSGYAAGLYLIKLETRHGITVRRVFRSSSLSSW
ncbi:MAG TPA: T9SS type A sorting domain-containing protein, partial [Cytophagales bacterium]